jgi:hypothetical protein
MSSSDEPTLGERLAWGGVLLAFLFALTACGLPPTAPCESRVVIVGRDTIPAICDRDGRMVATPPAPPHAP